MKPYILSQKDNELYKIDWKQSGDDIRFDSDFQIEYCAYAKENRYIE